MNASSEADSPHWTCRVDGVAFGDSFMLGTSNQVDLCNTGDKALEYRDWHTVSFYFQGRESESKCL